MTNAVYTKFYNEIPVDSEEIFRYMGCREADEKTLSLVNDCLSEALPKLVYKVCYRQFSIHATHCKVDLSFMLSDSEALKKNLKGCDRIIVFAATVGIELDRLIAKYGKLSPSKALCFQAIGAERIESLCNTFNEDIKKRFDSENLFSKPRFSPGYGDLPLETQKDFFGVLDCYRKIGLSLNDSLLMSPSKSVTALIGFGPKDCLEDSVTVNQFGCEIEAGSRERSADAKMPEADKCKLCENKNCSFRR